MILAYFLILIATALAAAAQPLETFVVIKSDGASFHRNTIPQIARAGDGRLFAVWGAFAKDDANGRMYGSFSETGGRTWSAPRLISWDLWAERGMNASGILLSTDGETWTLHGNLHALVPDKVRPGFTNGLCEPSIVQLESGEIMMLLRSGGPRHYESRRRDGGLTWSQPAPSSLTGSNTPTALLRNDKNESEIVAVWNSNPFQRWPLVTAISSDGGRKWSPPRILANAGQRVSYPGLTQTTDGTFVAIWQEDIAGGGRDIRCARFTREWLGGGN